jgi:hypothetical protein
MEDRKHRSSFLDLLEVWRSKLALPSGNLAPDLLSHLGNINQLILEGLSTEKKSARIEMGESIITMYYFSTLMLKGHCPLFQRLPRLIEETDDAALRWKYRRRILRNAHYHLMQSPDSLIEEGVQYFSAGSTPVGEGDFILLSADVALITWESDIAVNFYNAITYHYTNPRYKNISKATEFNKLAFSLAQQANDIDLQLIVLETELDIAFRCYNIQTGPSKWYRKLEIFRYLHLWFPRNIAGLYKSDNVH